jgi:hypothetical protein
LKDATSTSFRSADPAARLAICTQIRADAADALKSQGRSGSFWNRYGAHFNGMFDDCIQNIRNPVYRLSDVHLRWVAEHMQINVHLLSCSMNSESVEGPVCVTHHSYELTPGTDYKNTVILHHRGGGGGDEGGGHYEAVLYRKLNTCAEWQGVLPKNALLVQKLINNMS